MPGVVRTTPQTLTYRTDDGQEHEVARGFVPELDYEADAFEQQMGGAGASAPMANLGVPPMLARDDSPMMSDAGPMMSAPQPAPSSSDLLAQGQAALRSRGVPSGITELPSPAARQGVAQIDAENTAARDGLRPGPTFQPPGAAAQPSNPGVLVMRRGGGGGGPRVTARMTQQVANPIDPSYGQAIDDAAQGVEDARADAAWTAASQAREEARIRQNAMREAEAARQGQQQAMERYQARVAERRAKIDADMERYQRVSEDPFAEKSTDAKITAMIGMALMGLGSAIAGTENKAMDVLNAQIEREREAAREKIRAGQGRLAELRDELGSEQAALDAHEAGIYERTVAKLQALGADFSDENMRVQADQLAAEARLAGEQARAQAAQAAAGTGEIVTERRAGGGGGQGRQVLVDPRTGVELTVDQAMHLGLIENVDTAEDGAPRIPGLSVADAEAARSLEATDRSKVRERAAMLLNVRHQMDRLVELAGRGIVDRRADPQTVDEYNAIRADLQTAITVAAGQGALSGPDAERVNNQIPSLDNLVSSPERAARLRDAYLSGQNQRLRPYGYRLEGMAQTAGAPVVRGR